MRRASGGSTEASPQAFTLARRYLRFGVRSAAQLRTYLQTRSVPPPVIKTVLAECVRRGWVDDRACAKLVAGRLAGQGYATSVIRARLAGRGLAPEAMEAALAPWRSESQELARAREAVQTRPRVAPAGRPGEAARTARWLARRGFSPDVIEQALDLQG